VSGSRAAPGIGATGACADRVDTALTHKDLSAVGCNSALARIAPIHPPKSRSGEVGSVQCTSLIAPYGLRLFRIHRTMPFCMLC